jgi:DNA-binding CsgD family transcriptional regulator
MALIALGRIRTRRGDPEAWPILDEALALAIPTATLQRLAPAHAARAEAAWLAGDTARTIAEAQSILDHAVANGHPWHIGESGYWLWKAGVMDVLPPTAAEPYRLQAAGDWSGAAQAWVALGCPYESARALAESPEEPSLREAFAIFDRLGARPASAMVAQRLRQMGAHSVPRGARPATRAHGAMLTGREVDVLRLIVNDRTNSEIAADLFLSPKTIERHVTAILTKLDVTSRREAARVARARNLLSPPI